MILSIIIPAYNAEPYIHELLDRLEPQINREGIKDQIEVLIVDDGSEKPLKVKPRWAEVIRQTNKGAAAARNKGLDNATGDYIAFIDADDLVVDNYIDLLLGKIKAEQPDYIYLSWKGFGGASNVVRLNSIEDKFPPFNLCVWNRVYKRSMIGKVRFNPNKVVAEDAQFIRDVKEAGKKKAFIHDIMYLYRWNTPNSLTKRVNQGLLKHNRVVYYLPVVPDDPKLLEEIKEADKDAEVIVMTNDNRLKGLEEWAMVISPRTMIGSELRGEFTPLFHKQEVPLETQIALFVDNLFDIGGIETFTYNFVRYMHKYYDIAVVYTKNIAECQLVRLLPYADIIRVDNRPIMCEVAINCRMVLHLPDQIHAKKTMNLVHTCKMNPQYRIADNPDMLYFVSEAAKKTFECEGGVIYNLTYPEPIKSRPIRLVSACRLTWEKGENRIIALAKKINELGLNYTWEVFTDQIPDRRLLDIPDGLIFRRPTLAVKDWIAQADYYVSLSSWESFGYSMVEALELGIPVISTDLPVLPEIGLQDGVNGWIVPLDINKLPLDHLKTILTSKLKFKYQRDNETIVEQWRGILGDMKPTRKPPAKNIKVCLVLKGHKDEELNRFVQKGEYLLVRPTRAEAGKEAGFYKILDV